MARNKWLGRGVAMVMALLIVVIMASVVLSLAFATRLDRIIASNAGFGARASYAVHSALALSTEILVRIDKDRGAEPYHSLDDVWNAEQELTRIGGEGDLTVTVRVRDEERKFYLRFLDVKDQKLRDEAFSQLKKVLAPIADQGKEGTKPVDADAVAGAVYRWATQRLGARKPEGEDLVGLEGVGLLTLRELLLLDEITQDLLYGGKRRAAAGEDEEKPGIVDLVTLYSRGKVNVNTAGKEVLATLPKVSDDLAQKIVDARGGGESGGSPFKKIDDLKKVQGVGGTDEKKTDEVWHAIKDRIVVRSDRFRVQVRVRSKDGIERLVEVVLARTNQKGYEPVAWFRVK